MSSIDTSTWTELAIGDVFEKIKTEKISGKAGDFPTEKDAEYDIPLLTSSSSNQGLTRFAPRSACPTILSNVISIASNGAAGETFYQEDEFAVLQDAYAIRPIGKDIPNRECGLFLASIIGARLRGNFDWSNKANWAKVKELKIKLPVVESEEIDWQYMEKRIAELEAERIAELEAYLAATGLNDYELTDEDKEILATKLIDSTKQGGQSQSTESGDGCWKEAREFKIEELFDVITPKKRFNANTISIKKNQGYPYVVRSSKNNGVRGYINHDERFLNDAMTFSFGQDTATIFWQEQPYFTGDKIKVLKPKFECDTNIAIYIINALNKSFSNFSWGQQSFSIKIIEERLVMIPIDSMKRSDSKLDSIDFDYMNKYIRAIEKSVIKNVVKYKNDMIKYTKSIISNN